MLGPCSLTNPFDSQYLSLKGIKESLSAPCHKQTSGPRNMKWWPILIMILNKMAVVFHLSVCFKAGSCRAAKDDPELAIFLPEAPKYWHYTWDYSSVPGYWSCPLTQDDDVTVIWPAVAVNLLIHAQWPHHFCHSYSGLQGPTCEDIFSFPPSTPFGHPAIGFALGTFTSYY